MDDPITFDWLVSLGGRLFQERATVVFGFLVATVKHGSQGWHASYVSDGQIEIVELLSRNDVLEMLRTVGLETKGE